MSGPRPSCRACGRPVIRARTAMSAVLLNVEPTRDGEWVLDLDAVPPKAWKWKGAVYSTAAAPDRLYQRHFDTCPRLNRPQPDGPRDAELGEEELLEQRDALAAALDARTHEYVPDPDDADSDLCTALTPHRCGLIRTHEKHQTASAVLRALAGRSTA